MFGHNTIKNFKDNKVAVGNVILLLYSFLAAYILYRSRASYRQGCIRRCSNHSG